MSTGERSGYTISETIRQQFVDRITNGYANDYLTEDEFEDRLDRANAATDLRQLRRLVADLPEAIAQGASATGVASSGTSGRSLALPQGNYEIAQYVPNESDTMVAIFGGSERKGGTPARVTRSINIFGGSDLDFRRASLLPGSCYTVDCTAVFGGVDVIVPNGVNVEVKGVGIFGGFDGTTRRVSDEAPTVRVQGIAVFGGVDVKVKD